jgi:hypothetical protein
MLTLLLAARLCAACHPQIITSIRPRNSIFRFIHTFGLSTYENRIFYDGIKGRERKTSGIVFMLLGRVLEKPMMMTMTKFLDETNNQHLSNNTQKLMTNSAHADDEVSENYLSTSSS